MPSWHVVALSPSPSWSWLWQLIDRCHGQQGILAPLDIDPCGLLLALLLDVSVVLSSR
jgi:hypothetical protein